MTEFIQQNKGIIKCIALFIAIFLVVATLGKLKAYRYIGSGLEAKSTITVTGQGKIDRAPDTAKVTFSVRNESKELKTAQDTVSTRVDAITKALKDLGIEERHIKTDAYNSYPQYNYPQTPCYGGICQTGTPTIRGYEVVHTITVAVKDLEKVNDVLGALGANQVSDINGPNFGFEDDVAIAREARDMAIADAKNQAKALAKSLGVRLVRIVSFSENGGGYNPLLSRVEYAGDAKNQAAAAPSLPVGDQNIQSNVTVIYEIR